MQEGGADRGAWELSRHVVPSSTIGTVATKLGLLTCFVRSSARDARALWRQHPSCRDQGLRHPPCGRCGLRGFPRQWAALGVFSTGAKLYFMRLPRHIMKP